MGRTGYTGGGPVKGHKTVERLIEDLKAGRISAEDYAAALAARQGKTPAERRLEIARKYRFNTWEDYQAAQKKRHEQALKVGVKLKALRERGRNKAIGLV